MKKEKTKVLLLFSGGLDSMLLGKIFLAYEFDVTGISFSSHFFDTQKAIKSAEEIGLKKLITKDISKSHLQIVKKPKHGHGKGLNPCIDCHKLMIAEAKKVFEKEKFDILVTGEILGQRPFSQNKDVFTGIEKDLGLEGRVFRPLCAKLLPKTIYEEKGLVGADLLFDVQGKSRKKQMELARKYNVDNSLSSGGGCRLTEPLYSEKLKRLFSFKKILNIRDIQMLSFGRHFWIGSGVGRWHIVLGKNKEENTLLREMRKKVEVLVEKEDGKGPTALLQLSEDREIPDDVIEVTKEAKKLIWKYSGKKSKKWSDLKFDIF